MGLWSSQNVLAGCFEKMVRELVIAWLKGQQGLGLGLGLGPGVVVVVVVMVVGVQYLEQETFGRR